MQIVEMTVDHIDEIADLFVVCFSQPWTKKGVLQELENKHSRTFVAINDNKVVGFINAHFIIDEGYINNIAVVPQDRKSGVGTALIDRLIEQGKTEKMLFLSLQVRESNNTAIKFYEQHNFIKVGTQKNAYEKPVEGGHIYDYRY